MGQKNPITIGTCKQGVCARDDSAGKIPRPAIDCSRGSTGYGQREQGRVLRRLKSSGTATIPAPAGRTAAQTSAFASAPRTGAVSASRSPANRGDPRWIGRLADAVGNALERRGLDHEHDDARVDASHLTHGCVDRVLGSPLNLERRQEPCSGGQSRAPDTDRGKPSPRFGVEDKTQGHGQSGAGVSPSVSGTTRSRLAQVHPRQRNAANSLACGGEDGVEHRRRGHRDGGLADAAPEAARGHDDDLDLGHLLDQH
jgi:hypothetical protein